jgi:NitT/TauT family transport system substrate-binding protein
MTSNPANAQISRRKLVRYGALALAAAPVAGLIEACGDENGTSRGGTPFNFNLGFVPNGRNAPFYYGREQGLYSKRNLDLTIATSSGTGAALQLLSAGKTNAAIVDSAAMMKLLGQYPDPSMKSYATLYAKQNSTIFFIQGGSIRTPKDLEGRTVATSTGSNEYLLFPVFAKANGIDPAKVRWKFVDPSVKTGLLLTGDVDATSTTLFGLAQLQARARPEQRIGYFLYGDHGVPGDPVVIAGAESYAGSHAEAMKAFVGGSMEALKLALANPQAAVAAMAKSVRTLDRDVALRELKLLPTLVLGPAQREHGFGWNDTAAMQATYELVKTAFKQPIAKPYTDLFSNEYVGEVKA